MNRIAICMAYYRNGGVLARHYLEWTAWPQALRDKVEVVIVDDGSPENRAIDVLRPAGLPALKILAMLKDVRWNQDACRNLAVDHAAAPWLLLTDMDHIVTEALIERVVAGKLKANNVYRMGRVSAPNLQPYKPHPNSWVMHREVWDMIGGYDERFAGVYGSDAPFRDNVLAELKARGGALEMLKEDLIRVPREVIADASTTHYGRKEPQDTEGMRRIRAEIAALPQADRRPARQGFAWEIQL